MRRFVDGRPVSRVAEDFLGWVCDRLAAAGKTALVVVWDNAARHVSQRVRTWIKGHDRRVKREGGVRIVACFLPARGPWLDPIEPKWGHGKRAIIAPDRTPRAREVEARACDYYGCARHEYLQQADPPNKVSGIRKKAA
jgi:hypothetical protein